MQPLVERWTTIVLERFKPSVYLPMITIFAGANAIYLIRATGQDWNWVRFAVVLFMQILFFLRMRVFDEIKDYETDLAINPHRPLARGVASFRQVRRGIFVFMCLELIIAWNLGFWPFLMHLVATYYSVMMFEEFFLGDHLRPHLTLYAVTHTFVSTLLGLSAAIAMTGMDMHGLHSYHVSFFLMNWAFFNVFEFARKTFADEEERPNVESYSKIYGTLGAAILSLSQGVLGNVLLYRSLQNPAQEANVGRISWTIGALILYAVACLPFMIKPTRPSARLFRAVSSFYLLFHYIVVVTIFIWK